MKSRRGHLSLLALLAPCLLILTSCQSSRVTYADQVVVGTFNIEWLGDGLEDMKPRTEDDCRRIADVIDRSGADVLGVQEIENSASLKRVLAFLPDHDGFVTELDIKQNVGVVFRKGLEVKKLGTYTPLTLEIPRMRAGLVVSCRKGAFDWIMMIVHLKSTSRADSTDQLRDESRRIRGKQAAMLRSWADSVVKTSQENDVMIVGDLNDFTGRRVNATLTPLLGSTEMTFLTGTLKSCRNPNWYVIDHVLASRSAMNRLVVGSERVDDMRSYLEEREAARVSDHCPVTVRFSTIDPDND
jgi:endonuclease/exonuclease/phosphatase family metal-dependent hydrolase